MDNLRPLSEVMKPPLNVTLIDTIDKLPLLAAFFERCGTAFGLDVETSMHNDFFMRRVRLMQFGNSKEQFVVDLLALVGGNAELLNQCQGHYGRDVCAGIKKLLTIIEPVLCSNKFLKVGVNLGFEYICFYWNFGLRIWNLFDCSVIERVIWAGMHSLAHYDWFSMEWMCERYLQVQIDKTLQTSFTIDKPLSWAQIEYAALDTRLPMALMVSQNLILGGKTYSGLVHEGSKLAVYLRHVPFQITGDNMEELAQIENDCVGSFQEMHVHGERLDTDAWIKRTQENIENLKVVIKSLDKEFIPFYGAKPYVELITEAQVAPYKKSYHEWLEKCKELDAALKTVSKFSPEHAALRLEKKSAEVEKKKFYAIFVPLRKQFNQYTENQKFEGDAAFNYSSPKLVDALKKHFKLVKLTSTEDEQLAVYKGMPVIDALRKYRKLSKEIGTYGMSWTKTWETRPCGEEGWLNPGDGRLHSVFNQLAAETGRSSSEKPNGQNLPKDKKVRSCFLADPPDEEIRISVCCDSETTQITGAYACLKCGQPCDTKAEEYVLITVDMSGAELRILADLSAEPAWVDAFNRGEDVHSVCTELQYPDEWPALQEPGCLYYAKKENGEPMRQKCECKGHKPLRDETKVPNFLIPYGGGPAALAVQLGKSVKRCKEILQLHRKSFQKLWAYLGRSGDFAVRKLRSFDMYGRRRLFNEPNYDISFARAKKDFKDELKYSPEVIEDNIKAFMEVEGREPTKEEMPVLTHANPTDEMIDSKYNGAWGFIERAGKNHPIQGTNVTIIKIVMGCGFDKDGKPYLWHVLPMYKARLLKMVHDELVIQVPKRHAEKLRLCIKDAFKRAAAVKMKLVVMESDDNVAGYWKK